MQTVSQKTLSDHPLPKLPLTGFDAQCHGAGGLKVPGSELLSREQAVPQWSSLPHQTTGQQREKTIHRSIPLNMSFSKGKDFPF